jgi:alkaline phosphatase
MKKIFLRISFLVLPVLALLTACGADEPKLQTVTNTEFYEGSSQQYIVKDSIAYVKNIILMVGDGMGLAQVYAAMTANKGNLHLKRCRHIGFSKTNSADDYITDSAAGATALACGHKTYNGAIAVDTLKNKLTTILEMAEEEGYATGLVATCDITHATPASFIAHQPHRNMYEEIAADFLKTDIDLFIGGGKKRFTQRKDNQDLTVQLAKKGYQLAYSLDEISRVKSGKLAAFLADEHLPKMTQGRGEMLLQSSLKAVELLSQNEHGFFLMIEGSQIDWGGHAKDANYVVTETLDFDKVIGAMLDFADRNPNTLVIITADHETGGLTLNDGNIAKGEVKVAFTSHEHTAIPVPVYAYGVKSEEFCGFYENTEIFYKMKKLFDF